MATHPRTPENPSGPRPRDRLGRPLPHGSPGVPRIPDDLRLDPAETIAYAQRLFDDGLFFHAHEVFEARWKQCPDSERGLWQGLAQFAVGCTHLQRGNPVGAVRVLERGLARLRLVTGEQFGLDIAGVVAVGDELVAAVASGTACSPESLCPQLMR